MRKVVKLAVIRIRGGINIRRDAKETLGMIGLTRVNHCVIIDDISSHRGMLQKIKDFVTWGEVKPSVLEHLLRKRGRLPGDERLTDELVRSKTKFSSIGALAAAICAGEAGLGALPGLKKVFRLNPPHKGYKATKRPFKDRGDLGYRGELINELILRMA
ncbi:MAG: 50S ribosomal protein L30 [Candidatus Hodarchaeaceae archaeon]|nr:50S ribosomal protein L30 [Candidatus Hodarchaeaceae archaeon]